MTRRQRSGSTQLAEVQTERIGQLVKLHQEMGGYAFVSVGARMRLCVCMRMGTSGSIYMVRRFRGRIVAQICDL